MFHPKAIYYEEEILNFPLGKELFDHYKAKNIPFIPIESHNSIKELRENPNSEFARLKQNLIIGVRKSLKYVPNQKTSDFLVPFTSSGCSAACLYCYLVCNYNKCSYLRLFVNREQMMAKLIKTAKESQKELTFEIGSNSDLILENEITGNLVWTIEEFSKAEKGFITLPTKFSMVEPILNLEHKGRVVIRMSVNPEEIIKSVEFGTSNLENRIKAINLLADVGYQLGILIAPVILVDNWQRLYGQLIAKLEASLSTKAKEALFFEVIFMTYSFVHQAINKDAFPHAIDLYSSEKMTGRGMGKYCYKPAHRIEGEAFFQLELQKHFPNNKIAYIV